MSLTPKEQAEQRRVIADAYDALAGAYEPLNTASAMAHRHNGQLHRKRADELDPPSPPQPEWREGDLVRDRRNRLWQCGIAVWNHQVEYRSTEALNDAYGPLTRVLTYDPAKQRIADPAKQEVVISLEGIDREDLDMWATEKESNYGATSQLIAIRAAHAAREQLGQVQ